MRVRLVDDPRAEVGEDVRVGVGAMECQLNRAFSKVQEHRLLNAASLNVTITVVDIKKHLSFYPSHIF